MNYSVTCPVEHNIWSLSQYNNNNDMIGLCICQKRELQKQEQKKIRMTNIALLRNITKLPNAFSNKMRITLVTFL